MSSRVLGNALLVVALLLLAYRLMEMAGWIPTPSFQTSSFMWFIFVLLVTSRLLRRRARAR